MTNPDHDRRDVPAGAGAVPAGVSGANQVGRPGGPGGGTGGGPGRRRPWWAWVLLAVLAVVIVLLILLLASRCGSGSDPQPGAAGTGSSSGVPAAPPWGAPGAGQQTAPGQPVPGAAPGGTAAPGGAAAPTSPAPGSAGAAGGSTGGGDVAAVAAQVQRTLAATPVTFAPDSPALTASGARAVDQVARDLAGVPAARVVVIGYTAPVSKGVGPAAQQLSDQRAAAVAQRLESAGVDRGRIETRGAADTDPRPSTAASRRAEITVS